MAFMERINGWLETGFRAALGLLMLAATALVFGNVVLRYFFNYGLTWSDEVTKYGLLWLVFLGSGVAARRGAHISMEIVLAFLPPRGQRMNAILVNGVCAALSVLVGVLGWQLAVAVGGLGQVGPASGVPVFWVYLAIPVGCVLMTLGFVEVALRRMREARQATGGEPPAAEKLTALPG